MDLYQILFRGFSGGHNQLCGILWQSAHRLRFCRGSKFVVSHWLCLLPLTQCWRYHVACDLLLANKMSDLKWPQQWQYIRFQILWLLTGEGDRWQEIRWTGSCAWSIYMWKSVPSPAMLASVSVTELNRYCSTVKMGQRCGSGHVNNSTVLDNTDNADRCC